MTNHFDEDGISVPIPNAQMSLLETTVVHIPKTPFFSLSLLSGRPAHTCIPPSLWSSKPSLTTDNYGFWKTNQTAHGERKKLADQRYEIKEIISIKEAHTKMASNIFNAPSPRRLEFWKGETTPLLKEGNRLS